MERWIWSGMAHVITKCLGKGLYSKIKTVLVESSPGWMDSQLMQILTMRLGIVLYIITFISIQLWQKAYWHFLVDFYYLVVGQLSAWDLHSNSHHFSIGWFGFKCQDASCQQQASHFHSLHWQAGRSSLHWQTSHSHSPPVASRPKLSPLASRP